MIAPPTPADEDRRLEALNNLGLLDTLPDPRFDRIARLACTAARAPIAVICFVDAHRQWFKSRVGLDVIETAREISFCGHAILQNDPFIVTDTREDLRFVDNPLVIGEPHARFYAGHPIHAPEGARVGTLCIIDTQPRLLSSQEISALADLAAMVDAELLALRFNIATRTAGIGLHERPASGDKMWWSDAMWEIYGQDPATFRPSLEAWLTLVHPEDREHVRANVGGFGKGRTAASLRYRIIRPDGAIRHLESIASTTERQNGSTDRIAGITLDVTEQAEAEQREYGQQQELRKSSHQAGMAEIATGVLHSVGNVVNSLGIANATIRRDLKALRVEQLEQATALIRANRASLASFLTDDERGQHLPDYLPALSAQISSKVQAVQAELDTTDALLEHLRDVVSAQQVRAHVGGALELVDLEELLDNTLTGQSLELSHIEVVRRYGNVPPVTTDRHKLQLILVNLLNNARDAVLASATQPRRIVVQLGLDGDDLAISIEDSGVGMSSEILSQIWRFGFTTKLNGQGFDLHNSANAAREIGATIAAHSDGPNIGSRFTIRLRTLNGPSTPAISAETTRDEYP
jgi:PAS domain S-box-containing protein